jgi:Beta-galactosidase/Glycosyl hydrolase family 53
MALRRPLAIALAAVACLLLPASAGAAKRQVPFGFLGAVVDGPVQRADDATLDAQMGLMARSGVESVRTLFDWAAAEPAPGAFSFAATDRIVRAAAAHGLTVLPIVLYTPGWASTNPADPVLYAPRDPNTYAGFMTALVGRYGPAGSFWNENPALPRVPIRAWQIWNEPAADFFWKSRPYQTTYTRLLRAAYRAVHAADSGAKVVVGGLAGLNNSTPWGQIKALYRAGAGSAFDVVAVHPFSFDQSPAKSVTRVLAIVKRVRDEMRRHGDARVPIWLTELSWTAAKGKIPRSKYLGFETTPSGQAERLSAMYRRLAGDRSLRIGRAYWYTWASYYVPQSIDGFATSFQYSGLMRFANGAYGATSLLSTYASTAARLEGCRKSDDARRCR